MYRRQTAYLESVGSKNDLSEILFLTLAVQLMPILELEGGTELTKFWDWGRPTRGAARFLGLGRRFAAIRHSAYLGYQVTINLGTQVQQQRFEDREQNRVESFLVIFAGLD